jgi:TetR/AcrR family transcriptional regulator
MRTPILESAARLFARLGYAGTSVQAIADSVGIKKPSLIYWFPSKQALRDAVVEDLLSRWNQVLPKVMVAATGGEDRFQRTLTEVLGFFREDPDRARLLMREILDHPDEMRRHLEVTLRPWLALVTEYIRLGQRHRQVRPELDPEAWTIEITILAIGTIASTGVFDQVVGGDDADAFAQRQVDELLRMAHASLFLDRPTNGVADDTKESP